MALMALSLITPIQTMAKNKTVTLRVVQTSDVHGCFFPYDFINRKPLNGTLARVSTYVKELRKEYGKNLILLDNGDILQGQPTCYYTNYVNPKMPNVAASVINYLQYDAQTMGNHDVETGHAVYDKWIKEVNCDMLGANIIDTSTGKPYVKPYTILVRDGVRIAILGLLTPAIPHWLNEKLWTGLRFDEMVSTARKWMDYLQANEHPDVVIGLFHSGTEGGITTDEYEEDASFTVAREVPGFDLILYGHDHIQYSGSVTNGAGKQVVCLDPSFQPAIDSVKTYVDRKIGRFENTIYTRDCYFGSAAFTDFIHDLQLSLTGADISFNAPLSFNTSIKAGDVYVSDMFNLYRYENELYVLRMTGEEVRKHLEMSYDLWVNTMTSADDHIMLLNDGSNDDKQRFMFKNLAFNFDSAAGIDYEVDVTKPDGQKVRILRMSNGEPFDEHKWYKVAMNSYRGNGGGELLIRGAGIPKEEIPNRIIYQSERDQRHYLMQEIEKAGVLNPQPHNNWRFVPEEWTVPAIKRDRKLLFGE